MSALQCVLTGIAWLAGLGAVPFVYVIQLANAMKTTAPPLSRRDTAIAVSPVVLCAAVLVIQIFLARQAQNVSRTLAWNLPAVLGAGLALVMIIGGWLSNRPAARRAASARFMADEERRNAALWQSSGWLKEYDLRVERGFGTSFSKGGTQLPGADWLIAFKVDGASFTVNVHSLGEVGNAVDLARHSRMVLQGLKQRLDNGWRPGADGQDIIEIQIPAAGA